MLTLKDGTTLTISDTVTDTSYMPLASVVMGDRGAMPNFNDPRIATQIMRNLSDPDYIKRVAYGLLVLFPEMPDRLAWYDHPEKKPSFGIAGLSIEDITSIMMAVAEKLTPQQAAPQTNGFRPAPKKR